MSTTYYLISDLHIGGDGGLARCDFEQELVEFLAQIAAGPTPAELIIVGDAFGFWELTDREGPSKLEEHRNFERGVVRTSHGVS
jgi:UDP-2,3-diacylglucosamine pyrophosphatase LpxH